MNLSQRMRREVAALERPLHGGDGWRHRGTEDFSANLNPLGPPSGLDQMLFEAAAQLDHYPDDSSAVLKAALAAKYGLKQSNLITGVGSSELIRLFPEVFMERGDKVLMPRPTFGEYSFACRFMGAQLVTEELEPAKAFRPDLGAIFERLDDGYKAVYFCNPNNPTSVCLPRNELLELIGACERKNVLVFLDETLLELLPQEKGISCVPEVEAHDNLLIIRSLTKSFAIPGLRVGYGLASKQMVSALERGRQTWNLGHLEQVVSARLISERYDHVEEGKRILEREGPRVHALLDRYGLRVNRPDGFYYFLDVRQAGMSGAQFRERMKEHGVLVRDCASFGPPYDGYARFCLKTQEKDQLLLGALDQVLSKEG
jgi:threonine-phosphate decarboxylase